jgi:hypothetical protein
LQICGITQENSFRRRSVGEGARAENVLNTVFALRRGISKAIAICFSLHLGIQILLKMVFVTIMNLIQQMLVFKAQHLILQECHVGSLIFYFLETLFLFDVVANQMIVFTLLFFQMVVDLENFDFSSKVLSYAVVEASKINKSIPFYNWAF